MVEWQMGYEEENEEKRRNDGEKRGKDETI